MNDIVKSKSFEDKMKDRVKESIGDLMTDEDLSKIVHRSMEEIFFTEKEIKNSWGSVTKTIQPLSHEMVREILTPLIKVKMNQFIKQHSSIIEDHIKTVIDNGLSKLMLKSVDSYMENKFQQIGYNITNDVQQMFTDHSQSQHNGQL